MLVPSLTLLDRTPSVRARTRQLIGTVLLALALAGCQADELGYGPKHLRPVSATTKAEMSELKMAQTAPVLMRIFKEENVFEVWKKDRTGRYALLKSYDICKWSGEIGPKLKEGDRQAPEGYYTITPALMNPNSSYHLAFNTGYPNAYDRAHGRTGTHLMVHGACSSRGCYAMSDEQIQEIYALARDAFRGGQKAFQLQAYPFRMTPENMARHWNHSQMPFWRMLKEGYDHFELTRQEPKVDVCGRRYVFNAGTEAPLNPIAACPDLEQPEELRLAVAKKAAEDEAHAIVIAARLEEERKADEERAIMIAGREEDARRRAEESRIAAERQTATIASFLGLGPAKEAEAAAMAEVAAAAQGEPDGSAPPREGSALALADEKPAPSMFARLFSFGDDEETVPPPAVATATAAPTAGSETPTAAVAATVVETVPGLPAGICGTGSALPTGDLCNPAVAGGTPVADAAPAADSPGLLDRIGSWF